MRPTRAQLGADALLAVALAVFGVIGTAAASQDWSGTAPARPIDLAGYLLVIAAAALLSLRRRLPLAVLLMVAVLTAGYLAVGYPYGPIFFSFAVGIYTAARHRALDRAAPVAVVALGLLLIHLLTNPSALPGLLGVVPASAWVLVPFAVGVTVRVTREAAERQRAEAVRQRVDEERLRVAHEVHDIVGHGLAAIRMQADIALHVMGKQPDQAQAALEAISRTSGEALDELRATLGGPDGTRVDAGRRPASRLDRLDELQQRMADAGARINVEVAGDPRPLPPAVDLAGYRIVQEALTNVLRHGEPKAADVHIDYRADRVVINVTNPIAAASAEAGRGMGLASMRQRVTSLGGEFTAGPTADHRFEVRAVLPTNGQP